MQNFKNLDVWRKSHALTLKVYESTSQFPREEMYGLTSQIRRACASIPTNIAEGSGRESPADFARFLQIAVGSASEIEYLIFLTRELKYITSAQYTELMGATIQVKKMLIALLKRIRTKSKPTPNNQ